MTQPLVKDLFDALTSPPPDTNIILNFGHSDSVQPFIAALGLYRDESDLLASDWPDREVSGMCQQLGPLLQMLESCLLTVPLKKGRWWHSTTRRRLWNNPCVLVRCSVLWRSL